MSMIGDEFAEFETDETTFDAMTDRAEAAQLVPANVTVLSATWGTVRFQQGLPVWISDPRSASAGPQTLTLD